MNVTLTVLSDTFSVFSDVLPSSVIAEVMTISSGISVVQILEVINKSDEDIDSYCDSLDLSDTTVLSNCKSHLGVLCALALSLHKETMSVKMTGLWETILWKIAELAQHWEIGTEINFSSLEFTTFKPWILALFSDSDLCPNPYLRLEMIRFVGMWPMTYFQDDSSGKQAAAGLVNISAYIKLEHLLPQGSEVNLFYSLKEVLQNLNKCGHLDAVAAAAVYQIRELNVGPEAAFFNHLVQLLKEKVDSSILRYQAGIFTKCDILFVFKKVLNLFIKLVFRPPAITAYGGPGLVRAAATSLITITASIVTTASTLQLDHESMFLVLVSRLDNVYKTISEQYATLYQVLRLDHAEYLSLLSKKAADSGLKLHHLPVPCQESCRVLPEKFLDSLTQTLMESPVLLHSSKMVVDESTLVQLLLESPSDPFTRRPLDPGSYSRLPLLQASILAWRKNSLEKVEEEGER